MIRIKLTRPDGTPCWLAVAHIVAFFEEGGSTYVRTTGEGIAFKVMEDVDAINDAIYETSINW